MLLNLVAAMKKVGIAVAISAVAQSAAAQTPLKAQTSGPGSGAYLALVAFDKVVSQRTDYKMQINASQTVTRSMIELGRGEIDVSPMVLAAVEDMRAQAAMYERLDDAPEIAENLRGIFSYSGGLYHFITYADSGIETLEDIKGKRVFLGPPNGAASSTAQALIELATGYVPGEDYEGIMLGWGAGGQAMSDRQVQVYVRPAPVGGAIVQQFGLSNDFRLLGLSEEAMATPGMQAMFVDGRTPGRIPTGTYKGQVNGDVDVASLSFWHVMGSSTATDEETIYQMTKALWENIQEFHDAAAFLRETTPETVFYSMNIPLHAGAYRYYREAGFNIPDELIPPEAK